MWQRAMQRAAVPAVLARIMGPSQQRLLQQPLQPLLVRRLAQAPSSPSVAAAGAQHPQQRRGQQQPQQAGRDDARAAATASADAGVPTSDGFQAAEVRLQQGASNGSAPGTTVVGLRGFFVGQKLDTAGLAAEIAAEFPLYAQIHGRYNTIFALEEEHAEHPDIG
jgi:hypothetical protein